MIELLCLVNRLTGKVDAELVEHVEVNRTHHGRGVSIAVCEISDLLHSEFCNRVGGSADSKSDEYFVSMKSRVVVAHVIDLKVGDRLDNIG